LTGIDIIALARAAQRNEKVARGWLIWLSELDSWCFLGEMMKIDPELESFFVAVALLHRTHPQPMFGVERTNLAREITAFMSSHPGQPEVLKKVRRNYRELGGRLLDTDPEWFYTKLADAYLDWLYSQPESMDLLPEALAKIERERFDPDAIMRRGGRKSPFLKI
jgi:hypothetical protein